MLFHPDRTAHLIILPQRSHLIHVAEATQLLKTFMKTFPDEYQAVAMLKLISQPSLILLVLIMGGSQSSGYSQACMNL